MTLLSPDKRTLLLHVPRTGGTARKRLLRKMGWTPCIYKAQHHRLCDVQQMLGIDLQSLNNIVCVIREPAERELSHWRWAWKSKQSSGPQFKFPTQHNTPDDFIADWRCHPIGYYERGWHTTHYQHAAPATLETAIAAGGYRYWLQCDNAYQLPIRIVLLEQQNEYFTDLCGSWVKFPREHSSDGSQQNAAFTRRGLDIVRRMYSWTYDTIGGMTWKSQENQLNQAAAM